MGDKHIFSCSPSASGRAECEPIVGGSDDNVCFDNGVIFYNGGTQYGISATLKPLKPNTIAKGKIDGIIKLPIVNRGACAGDVYFDLKDKVEKLNTYNGSVTLYFSSEDKIVDFLKRFKVGDSNKTIIIYLKDEYIGYMRARPEIGGWTYVVPLKMLKICLKYNLPVNNEFFYIDTDNNIVYFSNSLSDDIIKDVIDIATKYKYKIVAFKEDDILLYPNYMELPDNMPVDWFLKNVVTFVSMGYTWNDTWKQEVKTYIDYPYEPKIDNALVAVEKQICGDTFSYYLKTRVNFEEYPYDFIKKAIDIYKERKENIKLGDNIFLVYKKEDNKDKWVVYIKNNKAIYEKLNDDFKDDDNLEIKFCKYVIVNVPVPSTPNVSELHNFKNEEQPDNNENKETAKIHWVDLQDFNDYKLVSNVVNSGKYNIVQIRYYKGFCVNIYVDDKIVEIGSDEINADKEFYGNHTISFSYKQILGLASLFADYNYKCNSNIPKVRLTQSLPDVFEAMFFAFNKGFMDKFVVEVDYTSVDGTLIPNIHNYDWYGIEKTYNKDFAYKLIEEYFSHKDPRMYKYVTTNGCFEYKIPNKYYQGIVEYYDKHAKSYEEKFQRCLKIADKIINVISSNVTKSVYIPNNLGAFIYNDNGYSGCRLDIMDILSDCCVIDEVGWVDVGTIKWDLNTGNVTLSYWGAVLSFKEVTDEQYTYRFAEGNYKSYTLERDIFVYPNKTPIQVGVRKYDKNSDKLVEEKTYTITDYKLGDFNEVAPNVMLYTGGMDIYKKVYKINCNGENEEVTDFSYLRVIDGFYSCNGDCLNGNDDCEVYACKSVSPKDYNYGGIKLQEIQKFDRADYAIFDVQSVKELDDDWVEVRIKPLIKLKNENEKPANSIIIDGQIIPKGEV